MEDKREKIKSKISLLLAKAESTDFGEERDALLAKVDALMMEYAIAEHELFKADPTKKTKPIKLSFRVAEPGSYLWSELTYLAQHCCDFFNCKSAYGGMLMEGKYGITCHAVGFEDDVRNAEALYMSLHLQLLRRLSPEYDASVDLIENVRRFKEAGMKWEQIWAIFYAAGRPETKQPEPIRSVMGGWLTKYKKRCAELGVEPVKANPKNYQKNFADGFQSAVGRRIDELVEARRRTERTATDGTSMALVLVDRNAEVEEAYKEMFPKLHHSKTKRGKYNSAAFAGGRDAGNSADLGMGNTFNTSKGAIG